MSSVQSISNKNLLFIEVEDVILVEIYDNDDKDISDDFDFKVKDESIECYFLKDKISSYPDDIKLVKTNKDGKKQKPEWHNIRMLRLIVLPRCAISRNYTYISFSLCYLRTRILCNDKISFYVTAFNIETKEWVPIGISKIFTPNNKNFYIPLPNFLPFNKLIFSISVASLPGKDVLPLFFKFNYAINSDSQVLDRYPDSIQDNLHLKRRIALSIAVIYKKDLAIFDENAGSFVEDEYCEKILSTFKEIDPGEEQIKGTLFSSNWNFDDVVKNILSNLRHPSENNIKELKPALLKFPDSSDEFQEFVKTMKVYSMFKTIEEFGRELQIDNQPMSQLSNKSSTPSRKRTLSEANDNGGQEKEIREKAEKFFKRKGRKDDFVSSEDVAFKFFTVYKCIVILKSLNVSLGMPVLYKNKIVGFIDCNGQIKMTDANCNCLGHYLVYNGSIYLQTNKTFFTHVLINPNIETVNVTNLLPENMIKILANRERIRFISV